MLSWAAFWTLLGSLLASLGPLGLPFGLSWAPLWALLGLSWTHLGPVLAPPGEILRSSRPSWAVLGCQQAFFESSGSTMIASSLSRSLLGGFFGSFKALQGLFLELFGSIKGLSWATWTSDGVC